MSIQDSPRRVRVSNSNAWIDVIVNDAETRRRGTGPSVQVRCGDCKHRLFDVTEVTELRYFNGGDYEAMVPDGSLKLERKCPHCHRLVEGLVTATPGKPWDGGLDGPWLCDCQTSLAHVDAISTRIRVTCRCRTEVRVKASAAIEVAYTSAAATKVPEAAASEEIWT